jgi:hypothetical protein
VTDPQNCQPGSEAEYIDRNIVFENERKSFMTTAGSLMNIVDIVVAAKSY